MRKILLMGTILVGTIVSPLVVSASTMNKAHCYQAEEYMRQASVKRLEESKEDLEERRVTGDLLTAFGGVHYFGNQKETYYNLEMSGVVKIMRDAGFSEEDYPYWVRDDGVKMLGDYVMIAADLGVHPRGSIVNTSLGLALVCDTGEFALYNPYQVDIAVTW